MTEIGGSEVSRCRWMCLAIALGILTGCLMVVPTDSLEVTYCWELGRDTETPDAWELWFDNPPNRQFKTYNDLRAAGRLEFPGDSYFTWSEDYQAIVFGTSESSRALGIRSVDRMIPYLGENELRIKALVELESGNLNCTIYYYKSSGEFLGNNSLGINQSEGWQEFVLKLEPPAETTHFALGIIFQNSVGNVALKEIRMGKTD